MVNITEDIINTASHVKSYKQLYDAPWKTIMEKKVTASKRLNNKLNIALICHPCYGFGDIIFALKIYRFMKEWYNIDCTMITTKPTPFIQNGLKNIFV